MKMDIAAPLQIFLLLLPLIEASFGKTHKPDGKFKLGEVNITDWYTDSGKKTFLPKTFRVSLGISRRVNPFDIRCPAPQAKHRQHPDKKLIRWKMCYSDITVVMTRKCPAAQSIDFSDLKITDFCIGEKVRITGRVSLYVGMSMPSTLRVAISRKMPVPAEYDYDKCSYYEYEFEEGEGWSGTSNKSQSKKDTYAFQTDACELFGRIMCPAFFQRNCNCPFNAGHYPLDQKIITKKDFLPQRVGFGYMNAFMRFNTPEGNVCLNIVFKRSIAPVIPWDIIGILPISSNN